jgi:predicted nucleotidyltransferase
MKEKLIEELGKLLKEHKSELLKTYGIREIGVFGSYVRGENRTDSDLDILVEFEEDAKMDLIRYIELEDYLSNLLGVKVDLVMKSALKPRIGKHILEEVVYL